MEVHARCRAQDEIRMDNIMQLCKEIDGLNTALTAAQAEIQELRERVRVLEATEDRWVSQGSEIEALKADLVFLASTYGHLCKRQVCYYSGPHYAHDGTPASILAAARSARPEEE